MILNSNKNASTTDMTMLHMVRVFIIIKILWDIATSAVNTSFAYGGLESITIINKYSTSVPLYLMRWECLKYIVPKQISSNRFQKKYNFLCWNISFIYIIENINILSFAWHFCNIQKVIVSFIFIFKKIFMYYWKK